MEKLLPKFLLNKRNKQILFFRFIIISDDLTIQISCQVITGILLIGRRLVKYIRHAFAHNILEKVNKGTPEERIHLQNWNINRKINDNKPYCVFDANIKFKDLKNLMQLILSKYSKFFNSGSMGGHVVNKNHGSPN